MAGITIGTSTHGVALTLAPPPVALLGSPVNSGPVNSGPVNKEAS